MPDSKQEISYFGRLSKKSILASFGAFPYPVYLMDSEGEILQTGGSCPSGIHENREQQLTGFNGKHPSYTFPAQRTRQEKIREAVKTFSPLSFIHVHASATWMHTIFPVYTQESDQPLFLVVVGDAKTDGQEKWRNSYRDLAKSSALLDAIPASVIVVDAHMRLMGWNRFSRDIINGRDEDDMNRVNPFQRIHPDDRDDIVRMFLDVLICDIERTARFRMHHRDSSDYRWATLRCRRAVIEDMPCVVAVVTETTELKKAEEEKEKLQELLQQSQKMEVIGKLAGGIAHDFNNILTGIIGNAEMVLEQLDPSSPVYENIRDIHRLADRSAKLTRQLLAFARKEVFCPKVMEINEAVADLLPLQRMIIGENIRLVFHPSEASVFISMDPVQLDQVLTNLFVNAREAISGCGTIVIRCETSILPDHEGIPVRPLIEPGLFVRISVADSGTGIDDKVLPHIFEPFFTTRAHGKGTGLGLSTVYGIVKQNNGHIFCRTKQGIGTTFDIYLPVCGNNQQEKTVYPGVLIPSGSSNAILLVEDEPFVLRIMKDILESHRFTVYTASNAEEGIRVAREQQNLFRLLVTDILLPAANGVELSIQLKKENPSLKVLFMSGYAQENIEQMKKYEQEANFIQKPFMINDFMNAVHKALALS